MDSLSLIIDGYYSLATSDRPPVIEVPLSEDDHAYNKRHYELSCKPPQVASADTADIKCMGYNEEMRQNWAQLGKEYERLTEAACDRTKLSAKSANKLLQLGDTFMGRYQNIYPRPARTVPSESMELPLIKEVKEKVNVMFDHMQVAGEQSSFNAITDRIEGIEARMNEMAMNHADTVTTNLLHLNERGATENASLAKELITLHSKLDLADKRCFDKHRRMYEDLTKECTGACDMTKSSEKNTAADIEALKASHGEELDVANDAIYNLRRELDLEKDKMKIIIEKVKRMDEAMKKMSCQQPAAASIKPTASEPAQTATKPVPHNKAEQLLLRKFQELEMVLEEHRKVAKKEKTPDDQTHGSVTMEENGKRPFVMSVAKPNAQADKEPSREKADAPQPLVNLGASGLPTTTGDMAPAPHSKGGLEDLPGNEMFKVLLGDIYERTSARVKAFTDKDGADGSKSGLSRLETDRYKRVDPSGNHPLQPAQNHEAQVVSGDPSKGVSGDRELLVKRYKKLLAFHANKIHACQNNPYGTDLELKKDDFKYQRHGLLLEIHGSERGPPPFWQAIKAQDELDLHREITRLAKSQDL